MQFGNATMFTGALILILAVALWQSRNFGYRAGLFPWVIGIPTFVLCFLQLARDLRGTDKKAAAHPGEEPEVEIAPEVVSQRTIAVIAWTVGFFLAIWLLGFSYRRAVDDPLVLEDRRQGKLVNDGAGNLFLLAVLLGPLRKAIERTVPRWTLAQLD